ncbi:MAG: LysM peptidoglycan-binding domain-containing protein, partial [Paludisphaera borealis]|uniref:LysM peptidoglycan-binding domain-containing protein n=1 Tax=Paludisphaera borealis TaxID=1387353 RepID=UPI00283B750D
MVESGPFPNSESDDPQALNPDAPADAPEYADDEHAALAEADVATGDATEPRLATEAEAGPATPGGFDKFRAAAVAAGGWSFEKASLAAAQGVILARSYPRAMLASGLSVLVLGGVLTVTHIPGPRPDADAESKTKAKAKADGDLDPVEANAKPVEPEHTAETAPKPVAETDDTEPKHLADAGASKTPPDGPAPSPDPAPAPERETHSPSLLAMPNDREPTPPVEPVKLTAGVDESGLPDLPAIDKNAGGLTNLDATHEPAPAPAITDATGLGALELAAADVKPGDPPHEEPAAPAPISTPIPSPTPAAAPVLTPGETKPAVEPEAVPAPEIPAPAPAPATKPAEPPAPAPSTSTPEPSKAGAEPTTQPPAPVPGLGAGPAPGPAAEPMQPLAAPAPVVPGAAAKEAVGAIGLGVGIGTAAGAAMKNLGDKPAAPSAPTPPVDAPPHVAEPQPAPRQEPQPSQVPAPAPANTPAPASPPGEVPSFQAVPEAASAPAAVGKPASTPTAEIKHNPTEEPSRQDVAPIRRSGNIVISDIGSDTGLEGDPFDRRDAGLSTDPDAHADKEMSFDVETYVPSGQDANRGGRGGQASATAPPKAAGKIDTVLHKVESGENFYSISQSYYSSGRYYRALANANSDKFKRPEDLRVGAVIRVPPPEDLDPAFIDPPGTRYGSKARTGPVGAADAA